MGHIALKTTGSISLDDLRKYLGIDGVINLSGISLTLWEPPAPFQRPFSVNQIFNSFQNTTITLNNKLALGDLYGKTFGIYTSYSRYMIHGDSYENPYDGTFRGYFGFGTSTNGRSGMLYGTNQGLSIGIILTVSQYQHWYWLEIKARTRGIWSDLNPLVLQPDYSNTEWEVVGEFEEIKINLAYRNSFRSVGLKAYPKVDSQNGEGVHTMNIDLEEWDEVSSSGLLFDFR